ALAKISMLLEVPAHFKWIAFDSASVKTPQDIAVLMDEERLYPETGMGRVGLIEVYPMQAGLDLGCRVVVPPLRFRAQLREQVKPFMESHEADVDFSRD